MPESAVAAMLDKLNVGRWNLHFALYGTPELIDARYAIVQRAFARVPQAETLGRALCGRCAAHRRAAIATSPAFRR